MDGKAAQRAVKSVSAIERLLQSCPNSARNECRLIQGEFFFASLHDYTKRPSGVHWRAGENMRCFKLQSLIRVLVEEVERFETGGTDDLLLQSFDDSAIVSFHLGTESNRQRRTLVLRNIESEWKIVHMHASSFDAEGELPTLDANFVE